MVQYSDMLVAIEEKCYPFTSSFESFKDLVPSFCSFDLKTFELLMKAAGSYAIILLDKYQYGGCFSALKLFSHRSAIGLLL